MVLTLQCGAVERWQRKHAAEEEARSSHSVDLAKQSQMKQIWQNEAKSLCCLM
jgi:hypothetical protein